MPSPCPGPVSRRQFLKLGALSLGAIGSGGITPFRLRATETDRTTTDTSVIFIWLPGGPPHLDTYDMKPDAPEDYRGPFRPIKSVVSGIDVCELLPMHARVADRFTLIRSIAHTFADHGGGHKKFLTGRDPKEPVGFVNDYPMVGSVVAKCREQFNRGVPNYIAAMEPGRDQIDVFSFGSAYLGPSTHPFTVVGDPSQAEFQVRNISSTPEAYGRLSERMAVLKRLDRPTSAVDPLGSMTSLGTLQDRAFSLLTTDSARRAFDLRQEPASVRERYGMHVWGQRCLLARRLVEAGASFVTMVLENPFQSGVPFPKDGVYNWDSHAVNCHIFNDAKIRFPLYDRAVSALIEDIYTRGLDRKVMLIVTGEFGRTPRIEQSVGTQTGVMQPGRDHWPQAMSVLVAGMGMRTGQVVGSTTTRGEHPKDRPLTPNDLWATMFHHLGIDHERTAFLDNTGRPMPILDGGKPIVELL